MQTVADGQLQATIPTENVAPEIRAALRSNMMPVKK
jgi:hypothetical protein